MQSSGTNRTRAASLSAAQENRTQQHQSKCQSGACRLVELEAAAIGNLSRSVSEAEEKTRTRTRTKTKPSEEESLQVLSLAPERARHKMETKKTKKRTRKGINVQPNSSSFQLHHPTTASSITTNAAEKNMAVVSSCAPTWRPQANKPTHKLIPLFVGCLLPLLLLLLMALSSGVGCVVVYQVRFIAMKSGRTDYAHAGESIELSCLHMMKDEAEDIKQLVWSKDGKNFLRWRKNRSGLEVLSYTFKGHVDASSAHSHLIIHNATIDMHGKYRCSVKTDLNTHESELEPVVVVSGSQCRPSDWRVSSDQLGCREVLRLDCRQVFPKPVPSCGLWNSRADKFIESVNLDISEEPLSSPNATQTYRVRYADKFELALANGSASALYKELHQYAGHLIFKCDLLIPDTSWRLSLMHNMFHFSDGCNQDPLEAVQRLRANLSQHARSRLRQLYGRPHKQFEELEVLASHLRYEILPPGPLAPPPGYKMNLHPPAELASLQSSRPSAAPARKLPHPHHQQQQQQHQQPEALHVNCWQKPRLGSRARLFCASSPRAATGANLKSAGPLKLTGTNLLECRPSGWVPIRPQGGARNSPLTHATELNGKKALGLAPDSNVAPRSRAARKLDLSPTNTNHSQDLLHQNLLENGHQEEVAVAVAVVGQNENKNGSGDQNGHDHDHDDHDSSAPSSQASEPDVVGLSTVSPALVTSTQFEQDERNNQIDTMADLRPGELASLLPTCVLIANNAARRTGDRLHLLNSDGVARESTARSRANGGQTSGGLEDEPGSWFEWPNFIGSSAEPSAGLAIGSQRFSFIVQVAATAAAAAVSLVKFVAHLERR